MGKATKQPIPDLASISHQRIFVAIHDFATDDVKKTFFGVLEVCAFVSFDGAPSTRQAHSQTQWFLVQIPSYHRLNGNLSTIELVVDMAW